MFLHITELIDNYVGQQFWMLNKQYEPTKKVTLVSSSDDFIVMRYESEKNGQVKTRYSRNLSLFFATVGSEVYPTLHPDWLGFQPPNWKEFRSTSGPIRLFEPGVYLGVTENPLSWYVGEKTPILEVIEVGEKDPEHSSFHLHVRAVHTNHNLFLKVHDNGADVDFERYFCVSPRYGEGVFYFNSLEWVKDVKLNVIIKEGVSNIEQLYLSMLADYKSTDELWNSLHFLEKQVDLYVVPEREFNSVRLDKHRKVYRDRSGRRIGIVFLSRSENVF